jgi:hypothetical protein
LQSRVEACGDFFFTPIRYLFHGKDVRIIEDKDAKQHVHHVASFYNGKNTACGIHMSSTADKLWSSEKTLFRTVLAVIFLVPGFFLACLAKVPAYLFESTRERHELVKLHFTPCDKTIGSKTSPLTKEEVQGAIGELERDPLHQKVDTLFIYGNGFREDPGSFTSCNFKPERVIVKGITLETTTDLMKEKWMGKENFYSIKGALEDKPKLRPGSSKPYHVIYQIQES